MIGVQLLAVLSALQPAPATAPTADAPIIARPDWVKRPSGADFAAVFPAEAMRLGRGGRATISCIVSVEGTLQRCSVVSEDPAGGGFGAAALALAPQFRMRPQTVNGKAVPATTRFPIVFQVEGGPGARRGPSSDVGSSPYIRTPIWTAAPTHAEVAAAYPAALKARGGTAQAQLDCAIAPDGAISDCRVVGEEPGGLGAGRAALTLVGKFRVDPPRGPDGGIMRRVRVRVPVAFSPTVLGGSPQQISRPEWGRLPEAAEVAALFPAQAKAAGLKSGEATLACTVQSGGALKGCTVARETPAGRGFGRAALALAPSFAMSAWTSDGRPVDGATVRIPIRYEE